MKRDPAALSASDFDIAVIGGGIYGAAAAWDAALRGFSVALIEKGDFASGTSSNSLKTVHGGLRYIQQADYPRMRESIRERRILSKIAPHLVKTLPCVMPTYGSFSRSALAMRIALRINDWVGFDRNQDLDPDHALPEGKVISAEECIARLPGVRKEGLTGAALWTDCQMTHAERLVLAFLDSAALKGAVIANYVRAVGFIRNGRQVAGVRFEDLLSGKTGAIRAKIVINASGPWSNELLKLSQEPLNFEVPMTRAVNLVSKRQIIQKYAAGIYEEGGQVFFIAPWRNLSLIGTWHEGYEGPADGVNVSEPEIARYLAQINAAYPSANLKRGDILACYRGILPGTIAIQQGRERVNLWKHYKIVDHAEQGAQGLISMVGVKYTTARDVAQKTIDLAARKLGHPERLSRTDQVALSGGEFRSLNHDKEDEAKSGPLDRDIAKRLIETYGSKYEDVARPGRNDPSLLHAVDERTKTSAAEILYAVREESAVHLSDVVLRRTFLGAEGHPGKICLEKAAMIMKSELNWDASTAQSEIEACEAHFSRFES